MITKIRYIQSICYIWKTLNKQQLVNGKVAASKWCREEVIYGICSHRGISNHEYSDHEKMIHYLEP